MSSHDTLKNCVSEMWTCAVCCRMTAGYGNNCAPYKPGRECCDECNTKIIIPMRMMPDVALDVTFVRNNVWSMGTPYLILAPRRSKRVRKPSLKARELNANMINMLTNNGESDDAWMVTTFIINNFKF